MHLHFLNIIGDNVGIVAHRLNPDELVFVFDSIFENLAHGLAPGRSGVGAIEEGDNSIGLIDVLDEIINSHGCDFLPQFGELLVLLVEELSSELYALI